MIFTADQAAGIGVTAFGLGMTLVSAIFATKFNSLKRQFSNISVELANISQLASQRETILQEVTGAYVANHKLLMEERRKTLHHELSLIEISDAVERAMEPHPFEDDEPEESQVNMVLG